MKTPTILVFLLLLTFHSFAQKGDDKLVRAAFDSYKSSILNDKGEEALKYVDSRTVKYYGDILDLVKNADAEKIEQLSILDKLMVFSIRHRASKEEILSFDGKGLLVYAIKKGMVAKNSVANNSIGEVVIDGDFAKGKFVANGKETPLYFHFYKEENQWKVDLTSLFPVANAAVKKMADDSGQGESEYILSLLEMMTGKKPAEEIWNPIQ